MKKLLGILVLGLLWCNVVFANNKMPGSVFDMKACFASDPGIAYNITLNVDLERNRVGFFMTGNEYNWRASGYFPIDKISNNKIYTQEIAFIELYPDRNVGRKELLAAENAFVTMIIDPIKKEVIQKGEAPYNNNKKVRKAIKKFFGVESGHIGTDYFTCRTLYVQKEITKPKKKEPKQTPDDNKIVAAASGTGFFVTRSGHIVTNHHVIEGCNAVKVSFKGDEIEAKVLAIDKMNDLAIIKAKIKPNKVYSVSREDAALLEDIIIAGFPLGKKVSSSIKTSKGSITALAGYGDNYSEFQTDAALNQGNSGGPIMNQKGNVVGVAVANFGKKEGVESFNFGIKSSTLRTFAKSNKVKFESPNWTDMSNKDLGNLITEATVYLECWMTVAKIKRMIAQVENRKAFFSEYN